MKAQALDQLVQAYPYPLAGVAQNTLVAVERWAAGEELGELPFAICRLTGLLLRLDAAVAIAALAASEQTLPALNAAVVDALRSPADGDWLALVWRIAKGLAKKPPLLAALAQALRSKVALPVVETPETLDSTAPATKQSDEKRSRAKNVALAELLAQLVAYRNRVIHGESLHAHDHAEATAQLEAALNAHGFYADYRLLARAEPGWLDGTGPGVPQPLAQDSAEAALAANLEDAAAGTVLFAKRDETENSLVVSPLLHYVAEGAGEVRFDDLFFVNRGTAEAAEYLAYGLNQQVNAEQLGALDAFRALMRKLPAPPLPKEKRLRFDGLAAYHAQRFVGRQNVLAEIEQVLHETEVPYVELRALAGFGKTAILAHLYSLHGTGAQLPWPEFSDKGLMPPAPLPATQDRWVFHFCMATDGRDDPLVALQSLTAQLCDGAGLERHPYFAAEVESQRECFVKCLTEVSEQLEGDARLIVCIDALDEGMSSHSNRTIPGMLFGEDDAKKGLQVPPRVYFLISYRVDESGRSRADRELKHIPAGWRTRLQSADPLHGLQRDDVKQLLGRYIETATNKPSDAVLETSWAAATRDQGSDYGADPFYLRFLIDGVIEGWIDLTHKESIPRDLSTVFEQLWMGLPTDHAYALHQLLATLSILREYATDGLMHVGLNQIRSHNDALSLEQVQDLRAKAGKLLVYDGDRYGLFHDRFAWFLTGRPAEGLGMALQRYENMDCSGRIHPKQVAGLHGVLGAMAHRWSDTRVPSAARDYVLQHGPHHLLMAGRVQEAVEHLTDYATSHERLKADDLDGWTGDLASANEAAQQGAKVAEPRVLRIWSTFVSENQHILRRGDDEWPMTKILLQLAIDHADDSPITQAAERWLQSGCCDWLWLRRVPRPTRTLLKGSVRVFEGHQDPVQGALTLTGGRLVSWSIRDTRLYGHVVTLKLWDTTSATELETSYYDENRHLYGGENRNLFGICQLADGLYATWGYRYHSRDNLELNIWDKSPCDPIVTFYPKKAVEGVELLSDGRVLSWGSSIVEVWDLASQEAISRFEHESTVCGVLELSEGRLFSWESDVLHIWDAVSGEATAKLKLEEGAIDRVQQLSDGKVISWGSNILEVWDPTTLAKVAQFDHESAIEGVLELSEGRLLSWESHVLIVWNMISGVRIAKVKVQEEGYIEDVRQLGDHRVVVWGSISGFQVWDLRSVELVASLEHEKRRFLFWLTPIWIEGVVTLSDGRVVILTERTLGVWNPDANEGPVTLEHKLAREGYPPKLGMLQLGNRHLVVWSKDDVNILLIEIETCKLISTLEGHDRKINGVLALTGERFISWADDNTLRVWQPDLHSVPDMKSLKDVKTPSLASYFKNPFVKASAWFAERMAYVQGEIGEIDYKPNQVGWYKGCVVWVDVPWQAVAQVPLVSEKIRWMSSDPLDGKSIDFWSNNVIYVDTGAGRSRRPILLQLYFGNCGVTIPEVRELQGLRPWNIVEKDYLRLIKAKCHQKPSSVPYYGVGNGYARDFVRCLKARWHLPKDEESARLFLVTDAYKELNATEFDLKFSTGELSAGEIKKYLGEQGEDQRESVSPGWVSVWSDRLCTRKTKRLHNLRHWLYEVDSEAKTVTRRQPNGSPAMQLGPFTDRQAESVYMRYQNEAGNPAEGREPIPASPTPWEVLSDGTQKLLTKPLHLHLFMEVFDGQQAENVATAAMLYRRYVERVMDKRPELDSNVEVVLAQLLTDLGRPAADLTVDDSDVLHRRWPQDWATDETGASQSPMEAMVDAGFLFKRVGEDKGGYRFASPTIGENLIYRHLAKLRRADQEEFEYWQRRAAHPKVFSEYADAFRFLFSDWVEAGQLRWVGPLTESAGEWLQNVVVTFLVEQARLGCTSRFRSNLADALARALAKTGGAVSARVLADAGARLYGTHYAPAAGIYFEAAVALREALWKVSPGKVDIGGGLGRALIDQGLLLSDTGKVTRAKRAIQRAVEIYEGLWKANPANVSIGEGLALALHNQAILLADACNLKAGEVYRRALNLYDDLWRASPDSVRIGGGLALALNNHAALLAGTGHAEAKAVSQRAVEIYEGLWKANPDNERIGGGLARALNNQASLLRDAEKVVQAKEGFQRAVEIYAGLWQVKPDNVYLGGGLVLALNNYCTWLRPDEFERFTVSEEFLRRVLDLYEGLWEVKPDNIAIGDTLASALSNLVFLLSVAGISEAEEVSQRAVKAYEALWQDNPEHVGIGGRLASSLMDLGVVIDGAGKAAQREKVYRQVVEIYETLRRVNPECPWIGRSMAGALDSLGGVLREAKQFMEGEEVARQAVEMHQTLLGANPEHVGIGRSMAGALDSLALLLRDARKFTEGKEVARQAVEMYRTLLRANPGHVGIDEGLAGALDNLALVLRDARKFTEGEEVARQAVEIYQTLLRANPKHVEIGEGVARVQNSLALVRKYTKQFMGGKLGARQLVEMFESLSRRNPEYVRIGEGLAGALNTLGQFLVLRRKRFAAIYTLYRAERVLGNYNIIWCFFRSLKKSVI